MSVVMDAPRTRFWWIPFIYLLRVQLLAMVLLVFGPPLALRSSLLNGLFDLDYGGALRSSASMAVVALAALLTAWTLLASSTTTLFNAPARFGTPRLHWVRFPITWPEREVFALMALPVIVSALNHSWEVSGVNRWALAGGAVVGAAGAVAVLLIANAVAARLQRDLYDGRVTRLEVRFFRGLVRLLDRPNLREGFIDPVTDHLAPGHMLAWVVFLSSVAFYVGIGAYKSFNLGYVSQVSALAYSLLLLIMLCWFLGGGAFFFDRYRIPILGLIAGTLTLIGYIPVPGSDHTYNTWNRPEGLSPSAADVLNIGSPTPILIAATGGGIQAAAWAAQVLTGIDAALGPDLRDPYAHSIRLMSTVSGGGVGAMYFAQRYRAKPDGEPSFAHDELDAIVREASTPSLDDVAWGVVYPDLLGLLFPPVRTWLGDRGQALETAWTRTTRADENSVGALLGQWRDQVWTAQRPANIFNATIVDTGERLVLGTSRIGWHPQSGLRNYEDIYPQRDVQVVTAARLAASFTYVSPAARADQGEPYHVVDGGYYDDYGMTSLVQWLGEGLDGVGRPGDGGPISHVLVIQIRSSPPEDDPKAKGGSGSLYQTLAPIETVLNVRTTGQRSHNDDEFERLQQLWAGRGVEIDNVIFRFCGDHPPLSWHLTGRDKARIRQSWSKEAGGPSVKAVRRFLAHQPIESVDADHPFDAATLPCKTSE